MTEPGIKHDQGKPRWDLIPLKAVEEVVKVMTFGANKYTPNGWKTVSEERYFAALLRHLTAYQAGELIDTESGLPHISHAACNAIFLTHFYLEKVNEHEISQTH